MTISLLPFKDPVGNFADQGQRRLTHYRINALSPESDNLPSLFT